MLQFNCFWMTFLLLYWWLRLFHQGNLVHPQPYQNLKSWYMSTWVEGLKFNPDGGIRSEKEDFEYPLSLNMEHFYLWFIHFVLVTVESVDTFRQHRRQRLLLLKPPRLFNPVENSSASVPKSSIKICNNSAKTTKSIEETQNKTNVDHHLIWHFCVWTI